MNLSLLRTLPISAAAGLAIGAGFAPKQAPATPPPPRHHSVSAIPAGGAKLSDLRNSDPLLTSPSSIAPLLDLDSDGLVAFLEKTQRAGRIRLRELAFRRLIETDPETAFRWYCAEDRPRSFYELRRKVLVAFAAVDFDVALEACVTNNSGHLPFGQDAGRRLCLNLKRAPSLDSFARMRTLCERREHFFELQGILRVATAFMSENDAEQLRKLFGDGVQIPPPQIPDASPPAPEDPGAYRQWLSEHPGEWRKLFSTAPKPILENSDALVDLISSAPRDVLEAQGKKLVEMVSTRSPQHALQLAESLSGRQRSEALGSLFHSHGSYYGRHQFALQILETNRDDRLLASIASEAIHDWARGGGAPYLALQAAHLLPEDIGPPADVFSGIMVNWSDSNPLEAIAALDDPRVSPHLAKAREGLAYGLQISPSALEKVLAQSAWDEARKEEIRTSIKGKTGGETFDTAMRELIDSVRDQSR